MKPSPSLDKQTATPIFDERDVDELVARFSINELRQELHAADVQVSVARAFGEESQEGYYLAYMEAGKAARDIKLSQKPKPKAIPGRVDTEAVKQSTDIVQVISRYTKLRKSGSRFVGLCPFHNERHGSLVIYPNQESFHCFSCSRGGDVINFIMEIEALDFKDALHLLAGGSYG